MQHSSKCFKSVGLTEKFKENSCKLILYIINETFHSYVNIKCLAIFFPLLFPLSSYWAPPPWPPLYVCLFYRMVGGLAWGHILLRGRINSWVLWLIHWTNSCSPSNSPLLGCPSHPRRGAARRPCLPLLSCWNSFPFLVKNALSLTEPPHTPVKQRCDLSPWPAGLQRASSLGEGHSRLAVAATSPSVWARFSRAHLLQSSGFATAVPVWSWGCRQLLQYGLKAFGVLERKGFQGQQRNEWLFVQI